MFTLDQQLAWVVMVKLNEDLEKKSKGEKKQSG